MIWKHKESRIMVVGIYAPVQWEEKWVFYQGLTEMVREGQKEQYKVVVAGDFNITLGYGDRAMRLEPARDSNTKGNM